jgi:hypothetical protein
LGYLITGKDQGTNQTERMLAVVGARFWTPFNVKPYLLCYRVLGRLGGLGCLGGGEICEGLGAMA